MFITTLALYLALMLTGFLVQNLIKNTVSYLKAQENLYLKSKVQGSHLINIYLMAGTALMWTVFYTFKSLPNV